MEKEHPINQKTICQSCGMPMKVEKDFGTERDGEKSEEYCRFCYSHGRFIDSAITLQGKIDKLVKISVEQLGIDEKIARQMAETKLPLLKRWKKE
ncbi:MAG: zinc ribbon domain-containing protein [Nanoarchaeota archaeon]